MRRASSIVLLVGAMCASSAVSAGDPPSFEGTWTNATITSLQRPERYKSLVIAASEVAAQTASHPQVVRQRTDDELDDSKPLNGSDLKDGRGYNAFWIDPGTTFARVRGEYRTSWIVDPPDGQIPFHEGVRERLDAARGNFDGPEARPLGERCIINSNSAGPPMLNYLYNNNYEFVQTADSLVIRAEMNNYARVIRIGGHHPPPAVLTLHGDSLGHWVGQTLEVETTRFHPLHASGVVPLSGTARVIERFTRVSPSEILYEFTVEDPALYARPWRGEMTFNATRERVFEYACHEGNYALPGILAGAREQERRQRRSLRGTCNVGCADRMGEIVVKRAILALALPRRLTAASAATDVKRVGDFSLLDQRGYFHQMSYYDDHKAVALLVQSSGRPVSDKDLAAFNEARAKTRTRSRSSCSTRSPTKTRVRAAGARQARRRYSRAHGRDAAGRRRTRRQQDRRGVPDPAGHDRRALSRPGQQVLRACNRRCARWPRGEEGEGQRAWRAVKYVSCRRPHSAQEHDLLLEGCRADPGRELRALPSRRRHRRPSQ